MKNKTQKYYLSLILIGSLLALSGCSPRVIDKQNEVVSNNALDQLGLGNFEAVESYFSSLQNKFEKGLATEYDLLDAYKVFYKSEDLYRPQLDRWIKAYPKSSSAYLARGVYFRILGVSRRGTGFISQVPKENLTFMGQMFDLSKKDLESSLRLNPKEYLAILNLMNIAQFEGDSNAVEKYLGLGNNVLPSNLIVRARYLISRTPRWGGSYRTMEQFIEACRSQGLPGDKIDLLNSIKFNDQGFVAEENKEFDAAQTAYVNALTLAKSGGPRFRKDYLKDATRICGMPDHSNKQYCQ